MGLFKKRVSPESANLYHGLREQALNIQPKDIGITLDSNEQVYCAVVDMPIATNFASLVCVFNGTVSLYYSNGGGVLGSGQKHKEVQQAGNSFLFSAGQTLNFFPITKNCDFQKSKKTFVYLLAGDGIHKAEYDMNKVKNCENPVQFLNFLIQNVLSKIRENSIN